MFKPLLIALLFAAPTGAFAQASMGTSSSAASPAPSNNLNNPQAQANQAGQPANAHTVPSDGEANKIPTPVVGGHPMTSVPQQLGIPK